MLAGLSAAYLERADCDGFRLGYRGRRPEDVGRHGDASHDRTGVADADLAALGAWLASLAPAGSGRRGSPDRAPRRPGATRLAGETLYAACAVCHGRSGEGNDALGAPRLAGQASWYTARQLGKFIDGVRGSHPDDTSGASMRASVADLVPGDVGDVVAWIETLPSN